MPLDRRDRSGPRVRVPARIELEPEASAERLVPLRPEIRAWLDEREVDVEEDAPAVSWSRFKSQRAVSACMAWKSLSTPHAIV